MKSLISPSAKRKKAGSSTVNSKQCISWCDKFFDQLDFSGEDQEPPANMENEPRWVINLLQELLQQVSPTSPLADLADTSPRTLGLYQGQMCANLFAMDQMVNVPIAKQPKGVDKLLNVLEKSPCLPGQGTPNSTVPCEETFLCLDFLEKVEKFEKSLHETFQAALDQPNHSEAVEFFKSFAKGLAKPAISKNGAIKRTTARLVYEKLYFHRREIEKLPNYPALRKLLIAKGISETVVGSVRTLQQVCERLGLHLAKSGHRQIRKQMQHAN